MTPTQSALRKSQFKSQFAFNPALILFGVFVLISSYPDGTTTRTPATTLSACEIARDAYLFGSSLSGLPQTATSAHCKPSSASAAGFKPNWDCIQNYNCKN